MIVLFLLQLTASAAPVFLSRAISLQGGGLNFSLLLFVWCALLQGRDGLVGDILCYPS